MQLGCSREDHGWLRTRYSSWAGKLCAQRNLVAAALREIFNADSYQEAKGRVTHVLEPLAEIAPKVCAVLQDAEEDLLSFYRFRAEHWTKIRSTNPLERVNKEIGRRTDVVGTFPNDTAVIRLVGALLSEQNDEWLMQRRYLSVESMALTLAEPDTPPDTEEVIAELNAAPNARVCARKPKTCERQHQLRLLQPTSLTPLDTT